MTTILLVGAADTGRAPMAVALLRRLVQQQGFGWNVASAGVLGHDGAAPEPEARTTMLHMGLDISIHEARLIDETMIEEAALAVAIDSGTARALRARFPNAQLHTLGELAGQNRDIPDPFRMQIGAWMTYARELESLLTAAIGPIFQLVGPGKPPAEKAQDAAPASPRDRALELAGALLLVLANMPDVIEWRAARSWLEAALPDATEPRDTGDLSHAYGGLLRAVLALTTPTPGQAIALRAAFRRLEQKIGSDDLTWLSGQIAGWAAL